MLTREQIAEFKAEGAVLLRGLIPPDVRSAWREQLWRACDEGGVDLDGDPGSWPAGRYAPEGGWPELVPNVYDLSVVQAVVTQLGDGAFAPSFPAGQAPTPQVPMVRVILPSEPGTKWAPPRDGHLDG
jgi:hypothetical protein